MTPTFPSKGYILALIVALAFLSRLYLAINTPLIDDEYRCISVIESARLQPKNIALLLHGDRHPPGQLYWASLGVAVFGDNLLGYRFASVLLGTLAVIAIYLIGTSFFGPWSGVLASFLLAFNEYHLNISRLCTEKNYLAFALFALVAVQWVTDRPNVARFVALGAFVGLGMLTKQTLAIWLPILALYVARIMGWRDLIRRPGPWAGLLALLITVAPDLVYNLTSMHQGANRAAPGALYQLSRLTIGHWSWSALALYLRPIYYHHVASAISEYASMTCLPGGTVLLCATASLFVLRTRPARLLHVLGFGTFLFFSLFARPQGEFWWGDLSLLPFILLAAGVLGKLSRHWRVIYVVITVIMLVPAWRTVRSNENYFPIDYWPPPGQVIDSYRNCQRSLITGFRDHDHLRLCSAGRVTLPVWRFYERNLRLYEEYLSALATRSAPKANEWIGWPRIDEAHLQDEQKWVQRTLDRASDLGLLPDEQS